LGRGKAARAMAMMRPTPPSTEGAAQLINRRDATLGLVGAMAALAATGDVARADAAISQSTALDALDPWADALFGGDPQKVAEVLAPEFQIVRSDGTGFDRASYLKSLPRQNARSKFKNIVATGT